MILPGAGRVWRAERRVLTNPDWVAADYELWIAYNKAAFAAVRILDNQIVRPTVYESLLTETLWLPNQGLVTRSIENPHLISPVQSDRQGEQQHTVLGRAVDPLHPPNDRPVS